MLPHTFTPTKETSTFYITVQTHSESNFNFTLTLVKVHHQENTGN